MIVCVCNRLNERDVRTAIERGARGRDQVHACLGADIQCGACLDWVQDIVDSHLSAQAGPA